MLYVFVVYVQVVQWYIWFLFTTQDMMNLPLTLFHIIDLVVGAGFNETVVVLRYVMYSLDLYQTVTFCVYRTRPVFQLHYEIESSISVVDVDFHSCQLNGMSLPW